MNKWFLIESIKSWWFPWGKSVRPIDPLNKTSPPIIFLALWFTAITWPGECPGHNNICNFWDPNFIESLWLSHFDGIKFSVNSYTDYIISSKKKSVEVDTFSASGDFIWCRKKSDNINSFFVDSGTYFSHNNNFGFESDSPVTIYLKDSKGVIISKGAKIKLNGSNFSSISFDSTVKVLSQSENHIEVELGSGTFKF